MRTGLITAGAQHTMSLIKNADAVRTFSNSSYDVEEEVRKLENWLSSALGEVIDVGNLTEKIKNDERWEDGSLKLSLQQMVEAVERRRIEQILTAEEIFHLKATSGSENHWITVMPLAWK